MFPGYDSCSCHTINRIFLSTSPFLHPDVLLPHNGCKNQFFMCGYNSHFVGILHGCIVPLSSKVFFHSHPSCVTSKVCFPFWGGV